MMRGWKNIFHANWNDKKARVALVIPDKVDFKTVCTIKINVNKTQSTTKDKNRKTLYNKKVNTRRG